MRFVQAFPVLLLVLSAYADGQRSPVCPHAYPADSGSAALAHRFIVDGPSHDAYGLSYPVTFVLGVPSDAPGLRAYKRTYQWVEIPTRYESEADSGVEAPRFDPEASRAYVSVAFPSGSDTMTVTFADELNGFVRTSFDSIACTTTTARRSWS